MHQDDLVVEEIVPLTGKPTSLKHEISVKVRSGNKGRRPMDPKVKAEKEVVSLDRMTEVERPPSLPVMNPRGRAAEGDFGEEERERQVQQLLADARAAVEKRRAENGEAGAEGSGNGDDAEDLPPPPAEEQGVAWSGRAVARTHLWRRTARAERLLS